MAILRSNPGKSATYPHPPPERDPGKNNSKQQQKKCGNTLDETGSRLVTQSVAQSVLPPPPPSSPPKAGVNDRVVSSEGDLDARSGVVREVSTSTLTETPALSPASLAVIKRDEAIAFLQHEPPRRSPWRHRRSSSIQVIRGTVRSVGCGPV